MLWRPYQALFALLISRAPLLCHCLALSSGSTASSIWCPLPHVHRREVLGAAAAPAGLALLGGYGAPAFASDGRIASIDSNPVIPVWPTWGGGRVVPVSLGGPLHDPFLLLAHHKHWFDPRDPLRGPFKLVGKALGLPYVDVEGFSMHPHRGLDILTYVMDGSDGFKHRDSLGGSRTYRGGCAQWMRTGAGVLHEEFWETKPDRRTSIELYQLWINLPSVQKFDEPAIHYVGTTTENPWVEESLPSGVWVRDIGETLTRALQSQDNVKTRPPVSMLHVTMEPGTEWVAQTPPDHSAVLYIREGVATLPNNNKATAKALQTVTLGHGTDNELVIQNAQRNGDKLDMLLLSAAPLREPIALGGPVVMNTNEELNDAYRQLRDGTFLDRTVALQEHAETLRRTGRNALEA